MTRPASYRENVPEHCCKNCYYGRVSPRWGHLLCFVNDGDRVEIIGRGDGGGGTSILFDGVSIGSMEWSQYLRIGESRLVNGGCVCDEWKLKEGDCA